MSDMDEMLESIAAIVTDPDVDDETLIAALGSVRDWVRILRVIEDDLVGAIAQGRGQDEVVEGMAKVRWSTVGEKWDRDAAKHAILSLERDMAAAETVAVDMETGEKVPTWDQCRAAIETYWLVGNPRKTPMRDAGLDVDEFVEAPRDESGRKRRKPQVELL